MIQSLGIIDFMKSSYRHCFWIYCHKHLCNERDLIDHLRVTRHQGNPIFVAGQFIARQGVMNQIVSNCSEMRFSKGLKLPS